MQMTKEESDRIRIVKWMAIVMVVFLHAYTTEVSFADGKNTAALPQWLMLLETGVSQVISRCGVPIFFSTFCRSTVSWQSYIWRSDSEKGKNAACALFDLEYLLDRSICHTAKLSVYCSLFFGKQYADSTMFVKGMVRTLRHWEGISTMLSTVVYA